MVVYVFFEFRLVYFVLILMCLVSCDFFGFGFNISYFKNYFNCEVINLFNIIVDIIRYEIK